ncbi:hypothetical protein VM636_10225 [Streptomyces sp. SCSIO 75703]|uniref:hypothetical protein n=1 Tax=unclassified Streptomyces TaxID=2593676 RepID=UPI0004C04679|nr:MULTISPECIES: hypothetical protein [unclassified Streptomyces]
MISIETGTIVKMADCQAVSLCMSDVSHRGTGLSGIAVRPVSSVVLSGLPVRERDERPTTALEAAEVAQAQAYAFAATGAGFRKQTTNHQMWAFRGPDPWSDPA